jgi:hypothetical protein
MCQSAFRISLSRYQISHFANPFESRALRLVITHYRSKPRNLRIFRGFLGFVPNHEGPQSAVSVPHSDPQRPTPPSPYLIMWTGNDRGLGLPREPVLMQHRVLSSLYCAAS